MNITFRVRIDDPDTGKTRRFTLRDDLPYPGVPRVDECVMLTSKRPGELLGSRRVDQVAYSPDGHVILDIKVDGLINDPKPQVKRLLDAGYIEQEPV